MAIKIERTITWRGTQMNVGELHAFAEELEDAPNTTAVRISKDPENPGNPSDPGGTVTISATF